MSKSVTSRSHGSTARERKVWQPTETYARASGPKDFRIKGLGR